MRWRRRHRAHKSSRVLQDTCAAGCAGRSGGKTYIVAAACCKCQQRGFVVNIHFPPFRTTFFLHFEGDGSPTLAASSAPPPRPRPPPTPPEATPGCVGAALADITRTRARQEPPPESQPVSARSAGIEEPAPLITSLPLVSPAPPAVLFERGRFCSSQGGGATDSIRSRSTRLSAALRAAAMGRGVRCDSPNGSLSDTDMSVYLLSARADPPRLAGDLWV